MLVMGHLDDRNFLVKLPGNELKQKLAPPRSNSPSATKYAHTFGPRGGLRSVKRPPI